MYNKQPVFQRTLNEKKCWVESQRTLKSETLLIYFFETEGMGKPDILYFVHSQKCYNYDINFNEH